MGGCDLGSLEGSSEGSLDGGSSKQRENSKEAVRPKSSSRCLISLWDCSAVVRCGEIRVFGEVALNAALAWGFRA